jgi:hypothetical protein
MIALCFVVGVSTIAIVMAISNASNCICRQIFEAKNEIVDTIETADSNISGNLIDVETAICQK